MQEKPEKKPDYSDQLYTSFGTKKDSEKLINELLQELHVTNEKYKEKSLRNLYNRQAQAKKVASSYQNVEKGDIPIDGDIMNGSRIFMKNCMSCHSLEKNNKGNKTTGPALGMIYGRKAGADAYFEYSQGLLNAQFQWSERKLFDFLKGPKKMFEDIRCEIPDGGIENVEERTDLIRFLKKFSKELNVFLRSKADLLYGKQYVDSQILTRRGLDEREEN